MDLALDHDQRLIVDTAERLLADAASSSATRAAADAADGIDRALWRQMAAMGWCGVHLPEAQGGLGLGIVELALLQEQLGRRLACVPFFDSVVLAGTLLREAADAQAQGRWLPALAAGESIAALADENRSDNDSGTAHATPDNGAWTLAGEWPRTGSAAQADLLLLPARGTDGEALLFAVAPTVQGLQVKERPTIDRTRRLAAVQARGVRLDGHALVARGPRLEAAVRRARGRWRPVVLAAEQVGVAQQCLTSAWPTCKERVQFGRPLAAFQALKHRCAQMMVAVEGARSAVYGAAARDTSTPEATPAALLEHAAMARVEATRRPSSVPRRRSSCTAASGSPGSTTRTCTSSARRRSQLARQRRCRWRERVAAQLLDEADTA
jgi:alkylation response protein AidB-like acyl-CoA dehydrogenase